MLILEFFQCLWVPSIIPKELMNRSMITKKKLILTKGELHSIVTITSQNPIE